MLAKDVSSAGLSSIGPIHAPLRNTWLICIRNGRNARTQRLTFLQMPVDATTGEHLELPQPAAQFEHAAINIDATTKSDTLLGKVDFDFDNDDLQ
jgi:hypothetical protein